ncbi:MAG: RDD family protein [Actinomycetota bacterium]
MAQPPLPPPPSPLPSAQGWAPSPEYIAPPAYAGFWIRVLGSIIDSLVLVPFYIPLAIRMVDRLDITSSTSLSSIDFTRVSGDVIGWTLALQFVRYVYEYVMIGRWNATVGKFAVGIRVRRVDGSPATWREAALRPLLELVVGVLRINIVSLVDDLWMLWDAQKQTLHDKIAGTIVVAK